MTIYSYKCQQCGLVVETRLQQTQATGTLTTLMCPECATAGVESLLVPMCGMECATDGTCGCAVPGFS